MRKRADGIRIEIEFKAICTDEDAERIKFRLFTHVDNILDGPVLERLSQGPIAHWYVRMSVPYARYLGITAKDITRWLHDINHVVIKSIYITRIEA